MQLDIEASARIIRKAQEKEKEFRYFLQWAIQLPNMRKENYVSFDQYLDRITGRNIDQRPVAECMAEIEEIKKLFK